MSKSKTIIVGLSGPSTSGKTTLARLLREIYNIKSQGRTISLFILHEDDFYKIDTEIPVVKTPSGRELHDWDCVDSLDLNLLESTLKHIRQHGSSPPELYSKEDQNEVSGSHVSESAVEALKASAESWLAGLKLMDEAEIRICILDGFLLFSDPSLPLIPKSIRELFDVKLFLRSTYAVTKARREARKGYVTLEGFWEDPEGYVDEIVWPNYVKAHAWMFENGDVDHGALRPDVDREGIIVGPGKGDVEMEQVLKWGCHTLQKEVEGFMRRTS